MHVKAQLTLKEEIFVWKYSFLEIQNASAKMQSGHSQTTSERGGVLELERKDSPFSYFHYQSAVCWTTLGSVSTTLASA